MMMTDTEETLHEMSFAMGHAWAKLPDNVVSHLCFVADGSRGLAKLAAQWTRDFEDAYTYNAADGLAYLNGIEVDGYLDAVDDFFKLKWSEFVADAVKKRLTA
jgi:hypothetical protein